MQEIIVCKNGSYLKILSLGIPGSVQILTIVWTLHSCRSRMSQTHCRTAHWLTCVVPHCCGEARVAYGARLRSSSLSRCARSWMLHVLSVLWASTRWPSPAWRNVPPWTRSSHGSTWTAVTCTATTTGASAGRKIRRWGQPSASAPCAGRWALTCPCGWAARVACIWTQVPQHTLSAPVATCAQKKQRKAGARSHCPTEHTLSTQHARSVARGSLASTATSSSSSKAPLTETAGLWKKLCACERKGLEEYMYWTVTAPKDQRAEKMLRICK